MLLAALLLPAACWLALPAGPAAADDGGWLRVAHLSPDTPAVDVALAPAGGTEAATATGLGYGSVSPWHRLAPGAYTVTVRKAGEPASSAPVLSARVDLGPSAARTVALSGRFADLRISVQDEDVSPPAPGRARVQVVDAASTARLDLSVSGGPVLASRLQLGTAAQPVELPGGRVTLTVSAGGAPASDVPVDLTAGTVTTLLVLDGAGGGLTVRPVPDAVGPPVLPVGPVQAGGGGTAPGSPLRLLAAVVTGIAGMLLLVTFRPRRRP